MGNSNIGLENYNYERRIDNINLGLPAWIDKTYEEVELLVGKENIEVYLDSYENQPVKMQILEKPIDPKDTEISGLKDAINQLYILVPDSYIIQKESIIDKIKNWVGL